MLFKESRTTHQKWTSSLLVIIASFYLKYLSQFMSTIINVCTIDSAFGIASTLGVYLCKINCT